MSPYEASFKVRHECPYRDLSEGYPDLTIREWHLSECQVVELSTPNEPPPALLEEIDRLGTVLHHSTDDEGLHVVTQSCLCTLEDSLLRRFEANNCLYQPPTVYRQGWEHYTVIAFDEADIRALLRDLETDRNVELLSKTAVSERALPQGMLAPVDRLFEGLTERQLAALRLALREGYYEQPRGTSLRDLAARTTVARSTFEEHLRKAENKVLTNAGGFLRLLTAPRAADPLGVEGQPGSGQPAD